MLHDRPKSFHTPSLTGVSERAERRVDFLKRAFDAAEKIRLTQREGATTHCELRIGGSRVNICQAMEGWPPYHLLAQLFVPDADAVFAQAIEAGATELMPMTDKFFGLREGRVIDPFGNTWVISTRKEEVSPEELEPKLDVQKLAP